MRRENKKVGKAARVRGDPVRTLLRILPGYGSARRAPKSCNESLALKAINGWIYSAIMLNAKGAASVPLRLYVRARGPGKRVFATRPVPSARKRYFAGDLLHRPSAYVSAKAAEYGGEFEEVDPGHPALELLRRVNPIIGGYEYSLLKFMWLEALGNSYSLIIRGTLDDRPVELWPLQPQYVEIATGEPGGAVAIRAYRYGSPPNVVEYAPVDVIHLRYPNPSSLFYGLGKIEAGWAVVLQNDAIHEMDRALYANSARPDYAVIVKDGASAAALEELDATLRQRFRDARDSGKFVAVTGDVSITPLSWAPKDLGPRTQVLEEIVSVFGVPRDKLLGNATYANAEQADVGWLRDTILPMLTLDESVLNERYLPLWGISDDAFLAYDDPVPENVQVETQRRIGFVSSGILTPNEVRAELGFGPVVGGDQLRGGVGGVFAGLSPLSQATLACPHEAASFGWKSLPQKEINRSVERLRAKVAGVLVEQAQAVLDALIVRGEKGIGDVSPAMARAVAESERWAAQLEKAIVDDLIDIARASGLAEADQLGSAFSVQNPYIERWARRYVPKMARTITHSRSAELMDEIARSLSSEEGRRASVTELRHRLEASPAFSNDGIANRAEMIARSETVRADTQGTLASWRESGVVRKVRWLLAPGACPYCEAVAASTKDGVGVGEAFVPLGAQVVSPDGRAMAIDYEPVVGPPLHPNCTCSLEPVLDVE